MNRTIQKLFESRSVVGKSGKVHDLHSSIDRKEGELLHDIIRRDASISKTLEVGCAFGISALHICEAIKDRGGASHTIIDPFQHQLWDGIGIKHLQEEGFGFYDLIETKSEFALPRLLEQGEGRFDFIFIDGFHTFDHTLLDCFYASRLLRVGGYLAIDDVHFASVRRAVDYLKNYPCYEICGAVEEQLPKTWKKILLRTLLSLFPQKTCTRIFSGRLYRRIFDDKETRMVALKKVARDERKWDWHNDAF